MGKPRAYPVSLASGKPHLVRLSLFGSGLSGLGKEEFMNIVVKPEPNEENPLWKYFSHNKGRMILKWHHYFDIYHNHFCRFRDQPVTILEIGAYQGGSLQMWKSYFGPNAKIYGVDINPRCKELEEDQIRIFIGDQADRGFLRELREEIGHIDIVIDDGGHTMIQQITTFEELFPFIGETGIYLVEDLHTSYWEEYGGGYKRNGSFIEYAKRFMDSIINAWHSRDPKLLPNILTSYWKEYRGGYKRNGSFIEYAKGFIDSINAWHSRDPKLVPNILTKSATGIHFYDSVLVIEKYPNNTKPNASRTGKKSF